MLRMSICTPGANCRKPSAMFLTSRSFGSPGHRSRGLPTSAGLSDSTSCQSAVSATSLCPVRTLTWAIRALQLHRRLAVVPVSPEPASCAADERVHRLGPDG